MLKWVVLKLPFSSTPRIPKVRIPAVTPSVNAAPLKAPRTSSGSKSGTVVASPRPGSSSIKASNPTKAAASASSSILKGNSKIGELIPVASVIRIPMI